jgi:hypothetical protein
MHKFKAILLLVIASALASCSSFQEGQRVIASENGNEAGKRDDGEVIEGVVRQAECNKPTGFGTVEIQVKKGKIIESTWYKVNSRDLCSKEVPSAMLGSSTQLTELGAANIMFGDPTLSSIRIVDGFVVEVTTVKKMRGSDYLKNVKSYETNDSVRDVMNWYLENRKSY